MPILTKPTTINKNQPATVTLDKASLAGVSTVAADAYWSDSTNWSRVVMVYRNDKGQKETLNFNATISSPTAIFLISDKARTDFKLQSITIIDFDNARFRVKRSLLTANETDSAFDVVLSGGGGGGGGASYSLLAESVYGSFYGAAPLSLAGYQGQTFQFSTPASGQLGKVRVSMMRQGNSDAVIGMRIRNAANAIQTISSTTINHDDVALNMNGDSGQEIEFLFDNEVFNMGSNTTYKFELYCVSGTQNPVMYLAGAANTYTGGNRYDENQGWAEDLLFKVFEKL